MEGVGGGIREEVKEGEEEKEVLEGRGGLRGGNHLRPRCWWLLLCCSGGHLKLKLNT